MTSENMESTSAASANENETPGNSGKRDIYKFYNDFNQLLKLDLPIPERDCKRCPATSIETPGHEIISKIRFLFFQGYDLLENITSGLANCRPRISERNDRHHLVLEHLNDAVFKVRSGKSQKAVRRCLDYKTSPLKINVKANPREIQIDQRPSPILANKHTSNYPVPASTNLESQSTESSFAKMSLTTSFMSETSTTSQSTAATSCESPNDYSLEHTDFCYSSSNSQRNSGLQHNSLASLSVYPSSVGEQDVETVTNPQQERPSPSQTFTSPTKSSLLHHRVSRIVSDGLAPQDIPLSLHNLHPNLKIEAYRVMRALDLSPEDFEKKWQPARTASSLYTLAEHCGISKNFKRGLTQIQRNKGTISGILRYSQKRVGPFFDLDLLPPRKEEPIPFQRKFGESRVLLVDLPNLYNLPPEFKGQEESVTCMVKEMLSNEFSFLGKQWVHFLVRNKKKKRSWLQGFEHSEIGAFQAFFFAVSGQGLEDVSITKFLDWAVPLQLNKDQVACKAYARIELAASKTSLGIVFDDNQLRYDVDDQLSNNMSDDETFTDPRFVGLCRSYALKPMVMNDGCCSISRGAMRIISKNLGLKQEIHALQGRICGAKGIWYTDPDDDVWIRISHSQIKSRHSREEIANDENLRTLNVLRVSRPYGSCLLHPGFLPILRDRGVPEAAILDIARRQVEIDTQEFLEALDDNAALHRVIFSGQLSESRRRGNDIELVGGLPNTCGEKVAYLLESGFQPKKCAYLKNEVLAVAGLLFSLKPKQFKIRLRRSTMAWGICDPRYKLPPGFAHFTSSVPLTDDETGETWTNLHGYDVLVSRNPSRRNSDIQKIRMVYEPELAHLQDVIVFSAQGPRPLASKLSGGDYDGDTFWVCWDKSLVRPFQNAPAPWEPESEEELNQKLEFFGLTRDKTTLGEIINDKYAGEDLDTRVRLWIKRGTSARLGQQWLGRVSNLHVAVTHAAQSISSRTASLLVDLHDLVIDADKNGYHYTEEDFELFKRRMMIPNGLPKPAHYKFTGPVRHRDISEIHTLRPDPCNIIDQLYFTVVAPEIRKALLKVECAMRGATTNDLELSVLYDEMSESSSEVIKNELTGLRNSLLEVRESWAAGMQKYHAKGRRHIDWVKCIQKCRDHFLRIAPLNPRNSTVMEWLRRRGKALTIWEELKVSALSKFHPDNQGKMMFSIAGIELCRVKAQASDDCRLLRMGIYLQMKPHKPKAEYDFYKALPEYESEYNDYGDAHDDGDDSEFDIEENLFENIDQASATFLH